MNEQISAARKPALSESLARKAAASPTLGKILCGEVLMKPLEVGSSFDSYNGQLGRWHTYEVTIPGARPDGSDWETYMSRWQRLPFAPEGFRRPADPRVTILTGEGETPFSHDPEVVAAVVDEMYRQEDLHSEQ